jgi:hypothetical protein
VQFLRCLPEFSGFSFEFQFGSGYHPEPKLGLAGFLAASANFILKIFFGNRIVRFTIICTNTRAGTDKLADERCGYRIFGNRFGESNHSFTELRRPLLQIKRLIVLPFGFGISLVIRI